MCDICHSIPCWPGCPNEPEPPQVFVCSGCSEPIRHGQTYYELAGEQWCESCVDYARKEAEYDPE